MTKIQRKINSLVRRGFTQAGFRNRRNAEMFSRAWEARGKRIGVLRSSGPTVENPKKRTMNAYYVIADDVHDVKGVEE